MEPIVTTGNVDGDVVNHPPAYNAHPSGIECIEISRLLPSDLGQAVQYIWRAEHKNGVEDLRKAVWFLRDHHAAGLFAGIGIRPFTLLQRAVAAEDVTTDYGALRARILYRIMHGQIELAIDKLSEEISCRPLPSTPRTDSAAAAS